ncbi:MAG: sulfonate ABC transporter [Firmicutes bacterium]|nr:sulfonate ABC transporter [Bacillota bacterium]MCL5040337.1 sulfonate ABC transporter [Bacillota bacterium]
MRPEVTCPVCGIDFEVPGGKGEGDIVECPYCLAQLKLIEKDGKLLAEVA